MTTSNPTDADCLHAMEVWLNPALAESQQGEQPQTDFRSVYSNWRDRLGWNAAARSKTRTEMADEGRLTLVHALADCGLTPTSDVFEQLDSFVEADHLAAARRLFAFTDQHFEITTLLDKDDRDGAQHCWKQLTGTAMTRSVERQLAGLHLMVRQTSQLVPAIAKTALAAVLFRRDGADSFAQAAERLGQAAGHYQIAWPLSDEPWPEEQHGVFARKSASLNCWRELVQHDGFLRGWQAIGAAGTVSVTTALIVQRLLAVLFREPLPEESNESDATPFCNELPILFARSDGKGDVGNVQVQAVSGDRPGFFLDPLTFGITALDDDMRESLRLSWRCCESSPTSRSSTVWIQPDLNWQVSQLHGGSAGGLMACGMFASAQRVRLDRRRTASCALKLSESAPSSGSLSADDVLLAGVGGVLAKWGALVARREMVECVLEASQATKWNAAHPSHNPAPEVTGAGTLGELFERLRGDAKHEDLLRRHLMECVAETWDRRRHAEADPAHSSRGDRDENETHRFDCYVQPDYRIEQPHAVESLRRSEQPTDEATANFLDESSRFAPVPGEDDEKLRQVLRLMFHSQMHASWENVPGWLAADQQRGPRWIVAYDNAGVGKTVFTHRMAHVLGQRETWRELFNDRPPIVVRQEGRWPKRADGKSMSLVEFLTTGVLNQFRASGRDMALARDDVQGAVEYALREDRVVIILDGFDQFDPSDRQHVVDLLSSSGTQRSDGEHVDAVEHCRWIVAGRVHVIDEHRRKSQLFLDSHWVRMRIAPFTQEQQDQYFNTPDALNRIIGNGWWKLIGITEQTDDKRRNAIRERLHHLLQLPMTLWYLRWLIEHTRNGDSLPVFSTLSELSLITGQKMLQRALETSADKVSGALAALHITTPFPDAPAMQLELLDKVLSLIAFQLMLEENYDGQVEAGEIDAFKTRCRKRFVRDVNDAVRAARDRDDPDEQAETEENLKAARDHWKWAWAVLEAIELNHRSVTEAYSSERLAFRSRKTVEARAARYLTRYASDRDIWGQGRDHREVTRGDFDSVCAFDFSNEAEWKDCWMLAIEMPRHVGWHRIPGQFETAQLDPKVTCNSLSVLFEQPKHEIRPNELVWRAWHFFELDDQVLRERLFLPDGSDELKYGADLDESERLHLGKALLLPNAAVVLERFRASSLELVAEIDNNTREQQQRANEIGHDAWLKEWQHVSSHIKSRTLVQCPPQSWIDEFEACRRDDPRINMMGNNPEHRVEVNIFEALATPITRGVWRTFDPALEMSQVSDAWFGGTARDRIEKRASAPAEATGEAADSNLYPIIECDWYDGWMFSRWLGSNYRLPSECQWEHACRAGTTTGYHFGDALNGTQANCNGDYPHGKEAKGPYLERTTIAGDAGYPVNGYGLFDVHGNVWEWCQDWYHSRTDEPSVSEEDSGPAVGSSRVMRGGTWGEDAVNCRSSNRSSVTPDFRDQEIGFRVVRVVCSSCESPQSSS